MCVHGEYSKSSFVIINDPFVLVALPEADYP